jgi:hypothetical protein
MLAAQTNSQALSMAQMQANDAYYTQQVSHGPAGYPYQGEGGHYVQAQPHTKADRAKNWADIPVESEDELNSDVGSSPSFPWIDSRSETNDSLPSMVSGSSRSHSQSSERLSSGIYSGSDAVRKRLVKKLHNRALTKEQMGANKSSQGDTSGFSSDGTTHTSMESSTLHSAVESSSESGQVEHSGQIGVASLGSARHDFGECKPCLFVNTNVGCQNGAGCDFCHFTHKRKSKPRPCKGKRDRYRKLLTRMEQNAGGNAQDATPNDSIATTDSTEASSTVIAI